MRIWGVGEREKGKNAAAKVTKGTYCGKSSLFRGVDWVDSRGTDYSVARARQWGGPGSCPRLRRPDQNRKGTSGSLMTGDWSGGWGGGLADWSDKGASKMSSCWENTKLLQPFLDKDPEPTGAHVCSHWTSSPVHAAASGQCAVAYLWGLPLPRLDPPTGT